MFVWLFLFFVSKLKKKKCNRTKAGDSEYIHFRTQREANPEMIKIWMLNWRDIHAEAAVIFTNVFYVNIHTYCKPHRASPHYNDCYPCLKKDSNIVMLLPATYLYMWHNLIQCKAAHIKSAGNNNRLKHLFACAIVMHASIRTHKALYNCCMNIISRIQLFCCH